MVELSSPMEDPAVCFARLMQRGLLCKFCTKCSSKQLRMVCLSKPIHVWITDTLRGKHLLHYEQWKRRKGRVIKLRAVLFLSSSLLGCLMPHCTESLKHRQLL